MEDGPSSDAVERLLLLLGRFWRTVTGVMADVASEPELVSSAPLAVLCTLDLDGPRRPGMLQDVTGLSSGGVSKLLDRMEEMGTVRRSYGAVSGDNRGVLVTITPRGRRLIRKLAGALAAELPETRVLVKEMSAVLDR